MGTISTPSTSFIPTISQSTPDLAFQLPLGLEDLSEEERIKILSVMHCAEIDDAIDAQLLLTSSTTALFSDSKTSESNTFLMQTVSLVNSESNLRYK